MTSDPKKHEIVLVQNPKTKLWHGEVVTKRITGEYKTKKEAAQASNGLAHRTFGPNIFSSVAVNPEEV